MVLLKPFTTGLPAGWTPSRLLVIFCSSALRRFVFWVVFGLLVSPSLNLQPEPWTLGVAMGGGGAAACDGQGLRRGKDEPDQLKQQDEPLMPKAMPFRPGGANPNSLRVMAQVSTSSSRE